MITSLQKGHQVKTNGEAKRRLAGDSSEPLTMLVVEMSRSAASYSTTPPQRTKNSRLCWGLLNTVYNLSYVNTHVSNLKNIYLDNHNLQVPHVTYSKNSTAPFVKK